MLAPATAPAPTKRAYTAEEQALIAKLEATRHDMLAGWRMMVALRKTGEIATDFSNERRALRACLHLMRGEPLPELRDNPDLPIESIGARAPRPPGAKRRAPRRRSSATTTSPKPPAPAIDTPVLEREPAQPAITAIAEPDPAPPPTVEPVPVESLATAAPPVTQAAPAPPTAESLAAPTSPEPHAAPATALITPEASVPDAPPARRSMVRSRVAHATAPPTRTHARSPRPRDSHKRHHQHIRSSLTRPRIRAPASRPPTRDAPTPSVRTERTPCASRPAARAT